MTAMWRRRGDDGEQDRQAARMFLTLMARCGTLADRPDQARTRERQAREVLADDPWLTEFDAVRTGGAR